MENFEFKVGAILYRHWGGKIQELTIVSEPKVLFNDRNQRPIGTFIEVLYKSEFFDKYVTTEISLGDEGIPGYNYDNRPTLLFKSYENAEKATSVIEAYYQEVLKEIKDT